MQDNRPASQPEIDLFYFLRPLTNLGKKIWHLVVYYFRTLRRNLFLFVAIVILCGVAGFLIRYAIKPAFKTEAIFVSHVMPTSVCTEILDDLNSNALLLDRELNISTSAAASIRRIETQEMKAQRLQRSYDSLLYNNNGDTALSAFSVILILDDFKYIDTIQHALIQYLENSPFARRRSAARREALLSLRETLVEKLESMDSVQQIVNNSILPRREYSTGRPVNPVDVYKATLYYNKQKIDIDQELSIMDNVEILKPFTRYDYFNYPDYLKLILLAVASGIVLAGILTPWLGKKPKML
jgi:hypothetical protein